MRRRASASAATARLVAGRGAPPAIAVAIASYRRESRTGLVSVARHARAAARRAGRGEQDHARRRRRRARGRRRGRRGRACGGRAGSRSYGSPPPARSRTRSSPSSPPRRGLGAHPPRQQPALEDLAVGRVVVDDQHAQARRARAAARRPGRPPRACATVNQNVLPLPGSLSAADLAAHHLDQLAADRQARARCRRSGAWSSCRPARRTRRAARRARGRCRCRCRAPSKRSQLALDVDRDHDLALVRELERVADEVGEHLAQAPVVAAHRARARRRRRARAARARARARGRRAGRSTSATASRTSKSVGSSSSLPASIFEKSRMSLMIASSARAGAAHGLREARAARRPAACPAAGRSCPARRSSACGSRG